MLLFKAIPFKKTHFTRLQVYLIYASQWPLLSENSQEKLNFETESVPPPVIIIIIIF